MYYICTKHPESGTTTAYKEIHTLVYDHRVCLKPLGSIDPVGSVGSNTGDGLGPSQVI